MGGIASWSSTSYIQSVGFSSTCPFSFKELMKMHMEFLLNIDTILMLDAVKNHRETNQAFEPDQILFIFFEDQSERNIINYNIE